MRRLPDRDEIRQRYREAIDLALAEVELLNVVGCLADQSTVDPLEGFDREVFGRADH